MKRLWLTIALSLLASAATAQIYELPDGSDGELGRGTPQGVAARAGLNDIVPGSLFEPMLRYKNSQKLWPLTKIVGILFVQFPGDKSIYCTANLISKDMVLTNSHCIWSPNGDSFTFARFSLGYLDGRAPEQASSFAAEAAALEDSRELDYAILKLGGEVPDFTELHFSVRDAHQNEPLMLAGYPYGYPLHVTRGGCQADADIPVRAERVFHHCDTLAGNSGSLLFSDDEPGVVVGLHRSALGDVNVGTRMEAILDESPILRTAFAVPDRQLVSPGTGQDSAPSENLTPGQRMEVKAELERLWDEGFKHSKSGDRDAYAKAMITAYERAKDEFGTESQEYAQANNHLIGAYTTIGKIDEAIAAAREAIRVNSSYYGEKSTIVAGDKANLAARLQIQRKYGEAEKEWLEAIEIFESKRLRGWEYVAYSSALQGYGGLLADSGDVERGLELSKLAVRLIEDGGQTQSIDYGWSLNNAAYMERRFGRCNEAYALFRKAADAFANAGVSIEQSDYANTLLMIKNNGCG